ncbi:type II toxin-antitoxin system ParD family antitoxin [Paludisphaera soli]|uniref:type II toxin-antitoxin system ParD family antitoxin n=1 Tax=Paludisphaera soli TaxID=2712865 RepID=UPI0013ED12F2|nr:type II toxin-antitoxin system ParD family antitoxin [Paludisphaera soli]
MTLSDELRAVVEKEVAEGGYESPDAYLQALVREAQRRRARRTLDAKLREALESGPATPMTREDWESLRQEALDGLKGEVIRP